MIIVFNLTHHIALRVKIFFGQHLSVERIANHYPLGPSCLCRVRKSVLFLSGTSTNCFGDIFISYAGAPSVGVVDNGISTDFIHSVHDVCQERSRAQRNNCIVIDGLISWPVKKMSAGIASLGVVVAV